MKNIKNPILLMLLFFFGCEFTKTDIVQSSLKGVQNNVNYTASHPVMGKLEVMTASAVDPAVQALVDSMKDVPKEDAAKLYTIYSGLALYIEQTEKVNKTMRVEQLIFEVNNDFGYTTGRFPAFSTAQKSFFTNKGWEDAKNIVSVISNDAEIAKKQTLRSAVVSEIKVLADAAKVVRDAK
jgi:hypothetical protein